MGDRRCAGPATAKPVAKKHTAPLDPQVTGRLLDLLSSDDKFRALFVSNPREALSQVGFVNETELASPHFLFLRDFETSNESRIAAARNEIRSMLTSGPSHTTPQLDAGIGGRRALCQLHLAGQPNGSSFGDSRSFSPLEITGGLLITANGWDSHCPQSELQARLAVDCAHTGPRQGKTMANNTNSLDPKIADRLLDLLGDSDKFRELFQQSPATALELIGHVEPAMVGSPAADSLVAKSAGTVSIASCLTVSTLASKETIRATRTELKSMLMSGLGQNPPQLDAGISPGSTLK